MLPGLVALICCQFAGEVIVRTASIPIPGPVIGLLFLVIALIALRRIPESVSAASDGLLRHLSLFFVPAGVGALRYADLLAKEGVRLALVLVLSTAITLSVTALVFLWARRGTTEPSA